MTSEQIRHLQNVSRLLTEAKDELVKCELPGPADLHIGSNVMAASTQVCILMKRAEVQRRMQAKEDAGRLEQRYSMTGPSLIDHH